MQAEWRPFFWEPVEGTGERLMAGVVCHFDGEWAYQRMLRDDVLESLYGKAAANPRQLIDEALKLCLAIAQAGGISALAALNEPLMGLHPGQQRTTQAFSLGEAFRQAVLMHASLASLDGADELEEADSPAPEESNKRFSTEVRELVLAARPDLASNFNRTAKLVTGGKPVRFGYYSSRVVLHFSVLHPVRQGPSVRDARARLWELARARQAGGVSNAALVTWMPSFQDPTLGAKQRAGLEGNRQEIEREADESNMLFHAVDSVAEARDRVLSLAA